MKQLIYCDDYKCKHNADGACQHDDPQFKALRQSGAKQGKQGGVIKCESKEER